MAEPRIVVAHREGLWWLLAEAAQLEHMIMCQYLFADFGLKRGVDEGLTGEQAAALGRWRATLHQIAVEEMLHLALVANLMAAIGAAPSLPPQLPAPLGLLPGRRPARPAALRRTGAAALPVPRATRGHGAPGRRGLRPRRAPARAPGRRRGDAPDQEFATVGHLYRGIAEGLRDLVARLGERAVFVGSPRAQATPELFRWPQLVAVTDLASAQAAVAEIVEQGEGARGDWGQAHYGRFLGIWQEYHSLRERDPSFEPSRPVLPAYTRQPFDVGAPLPLITDPLTHRLAELTALAYELCCSC